MTSDALPVHLGQSKKLSIIEFSGSFLEALDNFILFVRKILTAQTAHRSDEKQLYLASVPGYSGTGSVDLWT